MGQDGRLAITAYSLCSSLGLSTAELIESLSESRPGLGSPPPLLPFEPVGGAVNVDPPGHLTEYDTRQARIALRTFEQIREPVTNAEGRYDPRGIASYQPAGARAAGGLGELSDLLRRDREFPPAAIPECLAKYSCAAGLSLVGALWRRSGTMPVELGAEGWSVEVGTGGRIESW